MKDFKKHFAFIYSRFKKLAEEHGTVASRLGLARYLDLSHGKITAWDKGQWPSAEDCWLLHQKFGFSLEWLISGEGEPCLEKAGQIPPLKNVSYDTRVRPVAEQAALPEKAEAARVAELERQVADLRELVETQKELITLYKERAEGRFPLAGDAGILAPGAPLLRRTSDRERGMTEEP